MATEHRCDRCNAVVENDEKGAIIEGTGYVPDPTNLAFGIELTLRVYCPVRAHHHPVKSATVCARCIGDCIVGTPCISREINGRG